jgi:hypothetical protein
MHVVIPETLFFEITRHGAARVALLQEDPRASELVFTWDGPPGVPARQMHDRAHTRGLDCAPERSGCCVRQYIVASDMGEDS